VPASDKTVRTTAQLDFKAITARQRQAWATGDFNALAPAIMPVAEALVASVNPHAGARVLDVACGSGNAALVAARRYCEVTGVDFVLALLDRARQRAAADGVQAEFREGDAQALPFANGAFDVVLSTFGVMFAANQELAAKELLRVLKPHGRIGLASWMPTEWGGDFLRTIAKYVPPPAGLKSPLRWGTDEGLRDLLGAGAGSLRTERRIVTLYFQSVDHAIDTFRTYFGSVVRAFQAMDAAGQDALKSDLATLFDRYNRATDGTLVMECAYLQAVATRT
jgi:SAM-dependent methyltransferase